MANAHDLLMAKRAAMMGGKALPYDAEVAYLRSDGNQFIDTGLLVKNTSSIRPTIKYSVMLENKNSQRMGGWIEAGNSNWCQIYYENNEVSGFGIEFFTRPIKFIRGLDTKINTIYNCECDFFGGVCKCNDIPAVDFTIGEGTSSLPYYLFSRNNYGTGHSTNFIGRIYGFSYAENGVLIQDLHPVIKDGIGYMHDRVTNRLFDNKGTGKFTWGELDAA